MPYNTGIATYIWVLANKLQRETVKSNLPTPTTYVKMRVRSRRQGRELPEDNRRQILGDLQPYEESDHGKILPVEEFRLLTITVERPNTTKMARRLQFTGKICSDSSPAWT